MQASAVHDVAAGAAKSPNRWPSHSPDRISATLVQLSITEALTFFENVSGPRQRKARSRPRSLHRFSRKCASDFRFLKPTVGLEYLTTRPARRNRSRR